MEAPEDVEFGRYSSEIFATCGANVIHYHKPRYMLRADADLDDRDAGWRQSMLTQPALPELALIILYRTDDINGVRAIRCHLQGAPCGLTMGQGVDVVLGLITRQGLQPENAHFYMLGKADWEADDPIHEHVCNRSSCSLLPQWMRAHRVTDVDEDIRFHFAPIYGEDPNDDDYAVSDDSDLSDGSDESSDGSIDLADDMEGVEH